MAVYCSTKGNVGFPENKLIRFKISLVEIISVVDHLLMGKPS